MNRDDIIRMALDARLLNYVDLETPRRYFICADAGVEEGERFAAHVAAAEREACALVAESYEPTCDTCPSGVANAIRGRGKA